MNKAPKDRWLLFGAAGLFLFSAGYVGVRLNGFKGSAAEPQPLICADGETKGPDGKCTPKPQPPAVCADGEVKRPDGKCVPKPQPPAACADGEVRGPDGKCAPMPRPVDPVRPTGLTDQSWTTGKYELMVTMDGRPVKEGETFYSDTSAELLRPGWTVHTSKAHSNRRLVVVWLRDGAAAYESPDMEIRPRLEGTLKAKPFPGSYEVKLMAGDKELASRRFEVRKGAEPLDQQ